MKDRLLIIAVLTVGLAIPALIDHFFRYADEMVVAAIVITGVIFFIIDGWKKALAITLLTAGIILSFAVLLYTFGANKHESVLTIYIVFPILIFLAYLRTYKKIEFKRRHFSIAFTIFIPIILLNISIVAYMEWQEKLEREKESLEREQVRDLITPEAKAAWDKYCSEIKHSAFLIGCHQSWQGGYINPPLEKLRKYFKDGAY